MHLIAVVTAVLLSIVSGYAVAAGPELHVTKPTGAAHPGQPYEVECVVGWQGKPGDYVVLPAEVEAVDWGAAAVVRMEAGTVDGQPMIRQVLSFVAGEAGRFEVPQIYIPYVAAPGDGSSMPATIDESGSTVLPLEPFLIEVVPDRTAHWVFGGVLAAALVGVLAVAGYEWRRRRAAQQAEVATSPEEQAQAALHNARRKRLDGDFYAFYLELYRVVTLLRAGGTADEELEGLAKCLKGRADEAGYKGVRPTDDQMEGDYRDVERVLAKRRAG